jgi:hypothetical protein
MKPPNPTLAGHGKQITSSKVTAVENTGKGMQGYSLFPLTTPELLGLG